MQSNVKVFSYLTTITPFDDNIDILITNNCVFSIHSAHRKGGRHENVGLFVQEK